MIGTIVLYVVNHNEMLLPAITLLMMIVMALMTMMMIGFPEIIIPGALVVMMMTALT